MRGPTVGASLTGRAASPLAINDGTSVSAPEKKLENHPPRLQFVVYETYPGSQQPPSLQQVSLGVQQELPWHPLVPAGQHPLE